MTDVLETEIQNSDVQLLNRTQYLSDELAEGVDTSFTYKLNKTKKEIEKLMDADYALFIKSLVSIEMQIDDEEVLEQVYENYRDSDYTLVHDSFYEQVEQIRMYSREYNREL